jgi:hypothetical protein
MAKAVKRKGMRKTAAAIGISPQKLHDHLAKPDAPRPGRDGTLDPNAVRAFVQGQQARGNRPSTAKEAKTIIEAKRLSLKLKIEEGKLMTIEDHMSRWNSACLMVKTDIQALPHKVAASLANKSALECSAILKAEINDCLRHLAEILPKVEDGK